MNAHEKAIEALADAMLRRSGTSRTIGKIPERLMGDVRQSCRYTAEQIVGDIERAGLVVCGRCEECRHFGHRGNGEDYRECLRPDGGLENAAASAGCSRWEAKREEAKDDE